MKPGKLQKALLLALLVVAAIYAVGSALDARQKAVTRQFPDIVAQTKVPAIDVRIDSFDEITLIHERSQEGHSTKDYPNSPYSILIEGNGDISFKDSVITEWAHGKLTPEQRAELLNVLNDTNYPYIAQNGLANADCEDPPEVKISVTLAGLRNETKHVACGKNNPDGLYLFQASISKAAENIIRDSYIAAGKQPGGERLPVATSTAKEQVNKFDEISLSETRPHESRLEDFPSRPYKITIKGDGSISFEDATLRKQCEGRLNAGQISHLVAAINDNNYMESMGELQSDGSVSHASTVTTSVVIDNIAHNTSHEGHGSGTPPPKGLEQFESEVTLAALDVIASCYLAPASADEIDAQLGLVKLYRMQNNFVEAYFWSSVASRESAPLNVEQWKRRYSAEMRDNDEKRLTQDEIKSVRKRVAEWVPTAP